MIDELWFEGIWQVERRTIDFGRNQIWTFVGQAEIRACDFQEAGRSQSDDASMAYHRSYTLERRGGGGVLVRTADGQDFVELDADPEQVVFHRCGDDVYHGHLFFLADHSWIESWRVHGRRKRYRNLGRFKRLA